MSWPSSGERNNPGAEAAIGELLAAWRERDLPRVHVRHVSTTPGSPFWPGQPGADFQRALAPLDSEAVIAKKVPDAFVDTGLERWLRDRGIASVAIVGVSTNNSVESTARSAGNLGFDTWVVSDATFAFAKPDFDGRKRSAEEVHAMALANLQGEFASVVSREQVLASLAREPRDAPVVRHTPSGNVLDLRAFVPARDFALSRRFYRDLGFTEKWGNEQVAEMELGGFRFLLQNFYVKEQAENFMMHLLVENADRWWEHIEEKKLVQKYRLGMARSPALQPWGLRVLYLADPTGVLWHIADRP